MGSGRYEQLLYEHHLILLITALSAKDVTSITCNFTVLQGEVRRRAGIERELSSRAGIERGVIE